MLNVELSGVKFKCSVNFCLADVLMWASRVMKKSVKKLVDLTGITSM